MINSADMDHVGADYFNSCNNLDLSRLPYFQAFGDILGGIGSDCSYIDEESLLKTYKTGINKFLVLSQNLQSIGNKLNKIMTSLDNYHKVNIFPRPPLLPRGLECSTSFTKHTRLQSLL